MTALDINQYYNDMGYVYDRLSKLEEFKENFDRTTAWKIEQGYFASQDFFSFREDYYSKSSFEFVDIKKN